VAIPVRKVLAVAALAPAAVLAACGGGGSGSAASATGPAKKMVGPALPQAPAKKAVSLSETGSTLLFPLISAWATAYQKLWDTKSDPNRITITTGGTGSGTGITDAATGTVNIGASDAYLSSSDLAAYPSLMNIALAISAQQVNYNLPGVKKPLNLDGAVLAGIYTGKITSWNDPAIRALNPGVALPSLKIVPLRRLDSSGDTFLFTSYLNAQDPAAWPSSNVGTTVSWPSVPGEISETGNGGMVSGCAATKGCIAYIGISYLSKTQAAGLGQARLKNAAGKFVAPTTATISAAASAQTAKTPASTTLSLINSPGPDAYPIINYEYAIVSKKQSNPYVAEDIRAFLYWCLHAGQNVPTYLSTVNFQPLPASVVAKSDALVAKIGS
jgi:phosphate transport system substrate-binding protein